MNKNNKETIERIQRVCGTDVSEFRCEARSLEDSFSTALYAYYFVKPGKATQRFVKRLAQSTIDAISEGTKLSNETGFNITACAVAYLIPRIMKLCRRSFDERWFEHQINLMDDDEFDDTLLCKYVERFDVEQVSHVFQLLVHEGRKHHLFMSETNYKELWEEIDEECKKLDSNLPSVDGNYSEFPMFIFDCLDKAIISKIMLKYIDMDKDLAGYIARVIYYMEPLDALEYSHIAMSYIDLFGFRVFD